MKERDRPYLCHSQLRQGGTNHGLTNVVSPPSRSHSASRNCVQVRRESFVVIYISEEVIEHKNYANKIYESLHAQPRYILPTAVPILRAWSNNNEDVSPN